MLLYLLAVMIEEPVATAPPPPLQTAAPPHNYLKPPPATCDKSSIDEVVVCGGQDERYRLRPIDGDKYADPPIRAETNFAGGVLGVAGAQTTVGGFPSNRIMLNFKIKF